MKRETTASDVARKVLEIESAAVRAIVDRVGPEFDRAVEFVLASSGRVVATGMGKSGIVAQKIAATFSSTGIAAYFMHPSEALHGDLGMIVSGDVVVALSNSGETPELLRLLELIRRLGARLIAICGDPDSTLARRADAALDARVDVEACPLDLVPTASTTAALAVGDALAVACYELRGFTARDFARYHPGGRLGRRLLEVASVMHAGPDVPVVRDDADMRAAVHEMSAKRLGVTCLVDEAGRLAGVLTDGDLRRWLVRGGLGLDEPARDAMTREPTTISRDALATEALRRMEARKITSLPVVDAAGKLEGLVQIHDLWRTELF